MENIIAAETRAEEEERAALERSRKIKADAVSRADETAREAERSLKEEVKAILEKARLDGEARAAEAVKHAAKPRGDAGKIPASAAAYVEREFYKRLEK